MDPNVTISTLKLSEFINEQAQIAKTEETRVALATLATDIGTYVAKDRSPTFNMQNWLQACGITQDFKRAHVAA